MALAPIAVFAHKRAGHLKQTLEALGRCALARESTLYVYSDGPKTFAEVSAVDEVRRGIEGVRGFSKTHVVCREHNLGLARSIITGVTDLCNQYGRVIVLEDDLVVAPGFLIFMNQALDRYRDVPSVMQVSGYMFPIPHAMSIGDAFLCRKPASWGWATWADAWKSFNPDSDAMLELITRAGRQYEFDVDGSYPYLNMLKQQAAGELDVWGVCWYASMFLREGLCLYPTQSLVSNIGMDGSGTHCDPTTRFNVTPSEKMCWQLPADIQESVQGLDMLKRFSMGDQAQGHNGSRVVPLGQLRRIAGRLRRFVQHKMMSS
jgi:hypothetical protein